MDIEIRRVQPEEYEAWVRPLTVAFAEEIRPELTELDSRLLEFGRTVGALDGDTFVGSTSVFSLDVTVPGGRVPMAGVTFVAVLPTHRRRGVNTALMRNVLETVHEEGREPLLGLWASESGIYGRFGYGVATSTSSFTIARHRAAFREEAVAGGPVRLIVDRDEALGVIADIYERVRATRAGLVSRPSRAHWDWRFMDFERDRDGAGPLSYLVHDGPDGPDGYGVYRMKHAWVDDQPDGETSVSEVAGSSPTAFASIWRYLLDIDLMERTTCATCPVDNELLYLLAEPRQLRTRTQDALWLRISDVAAALEGRRYAVDGSVTIGVRDDVCPWVEGTYLLEAGPDGATCRRDDAASADVVLSARELAAIYLGGTGLGALAHAGLVDEETPGAVERANTMFATALAPWCPAFF
jgi:predicted acetyltransferase